eukprot:8397871-Ditylum_brightwellii.AAC.1
MKDGVKYPMSKLPEKERKERLDAMLERGNHKSACGEENEKILPSSQKRIQRASINKKGEVVAKNQAVHDLLFEKRKICKPEDQDG